MHLLVNVPDLPLLPRLLYDPEFGYVYVQAQVQVQVQAQVHVMAKLESTLVSPRLN